MTQHTDMGGLTRREQIARIIEPAAYWGDPGTNAEQQDALAKADAIEALSIPQGLGEDEVERIDWPTQEEWDRHTEADRLAWAARHYRNGPRRE